MSPIIWRTKYYAISSAGNVDCSVFARGGAFEHKAGLFPGTDYWQDLVGGVLADSGTLIHKNDSYIKWQDWQDVVGDNSTGSVRSSFQTTQKNSFPILTGLKSASWDNADDPQDGRISLITRAAPRSSVQVDWSVYQQGLLPAGITRDHYEVELDTGSQLTSIPQVAWETDNPQDVRLRIWSQAQTPVPLVQCHMESLLPGKPSEECNRRTSGRNAITIRHRTSGR